MTWRQLSDARPDLAAFGVARLHGKVAYLATSQRDGAPRVHPVTPIIGDGRLFLFMEPTSPKGHDLRRDPRFALHAAVADNDGGEGEFAVTGRARFVDAPDVRALATELATYKPAERHILFELDVERASSAVYPEGRAVRERWPS